MCKTSEQILETYPHFFGHENLLGSASISRGGRSEVGGGGKLPRLPPVATPLSVTIASFYDELDALLQLNCEICRTAEKKVHFIQNACTTA